MSSPSFSNVSSCVSFNFQAFEKNLEAFRVGLYHLPESREKANPILQNAEIGREHMAGNLLEIKERYERLLFDMQKLMERLVLTLKSKGVEHKEVEEACLSWCIIIEQLLDWVSETEKALAMQSASPDDVKQIEEQIEQQRVSALIGDLGRRQGAPLRPLQSQMRRQLCSSCD